MEKIQEISERLLLALYSVYRDKGEISGDDVISFEYDKEWSVASEHTELVKIMLNVSNGSVLNLKSSIKYLEEKRLIKLSRTGSLAGDFDIHDIEITSKGIDIIEGATGPQASRAIYQNTFNVKLAENISLESLITAKLGAEFKLF